MQKDELICHCKILERTQIVTHGLLEDKPWHIYSRKFCVVMNEGNPYEFTWDDFQDIFYSVQ